MIRTENTYEVLLLLVSEAILDHRITFIDHPVFGSASNMERYLTIPDVTLYLITFVTSVVAEAASSILPCKLTKSLSITYDCVLGTKVFVSQICIP